MEGLVDFLKFFLVMMGIIGVIGGGLIYLMKKSGAKEKARQERIKKRFMEGREDFSIEDIVTIIQSSKGYFPYSMVLKGDEYLIERTKSLFSIRYLGRTVFSFNCRGETLAYAVNSISSSQIQEKRTHILKAADLYFEVAT